MRIDLRMPEPKLTMAETLAKSARLDRLLASEIGGDGMSKLKGMAALAHSLPRKLDALADKAVARMTDLEKRGAAAIDGVHRELDKVEHGVLASEDALNQMTNGGPPLEDSGSASKPSGVPAS